MSVYTLNMSIGDAHYAGSYADLMGLVNSLPPGSIVYMSGESSMAKEHGDMPDLVREWFRKGHLRAVTLGEDHGWVTVFQKRRDKDHLADIQSGVM